MKKIIFIMAGLLCVPVLAWAEQGTAIIKGTAVGSKISGEVVFTEVDGGLRVDAKISNVPPGKHGLHIHDNASCDDAGKAAGGYFNPDKSPHGFYPKDGAKKSMAGDMGNIEVGSNGTGTLKLFMEGLTLFDGDYAVAGKSVIVHEREDDFSQPSGNTGGPIGCGIVVDLNDQPDQ